MAPFKHRALDIRWLRKPRYRKFILVGSLIFSINVFLVYNLVNSYRDPSFEEEDPSGRGRFHAEGGSLQDDDENNVNMNSDDVFIKQQKLHIELERKKLKEKQVPDSQGGYVNSNKLQSAIGSNNVTRLKVEELDFKPWCKITTREAISAIHRAKSQLCKRELVNVTCLMQKGELFPKRLSSTCPAEGVTAGKGLGCFQDDKSLRLLSGYFVSLDKTNSPQNCINLCLQSGFPYAGVEYWTECFCGVEEPPSKSRLADSSCNMKCPADPRLACGGFLTINIYQTGILKFSPQVPQTVPSESEPRVRIAYLLTLSGRALRQVKRLLKALFHKDHYFFIHVDVRQDYLFRELLYLETLLPNVRLMRNRHATMWAGASLLQTLINAMREMLSMPWQWDFVINLSESDFPIKTNEKLVTFLTANKNHNFVKSTGREIQRFIQKQGLDKYFLECDGHMWRVGDRTLPAGVQMDGGSDWMGLSRPFVQYVTSQDRDSLLQGLDQVYKYTLLPAESYFHTVLRNSEFCNTYIDNNLHLTNWKRHLGCKCQYKHIVDWCGCSPNDFTLADWAKITGTSSNQLFFARKFEAIINQGIINKVSDWVYGSRDSQGLMGYWQSIYHHSDLTPPRDDFVMTLTASLARLAAKSSSSSFQPSQILDLSSYHHDEAFQGLLLRYRGRVNGTGSQVEMETWFRVKSHFKLLDEVNGKFIQNLQVSSDFDVKESTTRDLLSSLSPLSEAVLIHSLESLRAVNLTLLVVDPAGQLAQVAHVNHAAVEDKSGMQYTSGSVKALIPTPLLPGAWTLKVFHEGFPVAETRFLVLPLQYVSSQNITEQQASLLHRGSPEYRIPASKEHWNNAVQGNQTGHDTALYNARRIDRDLTEWIDSLTTQFYSVVETCQISPSPSSLEPCAATVWSSHAPDPKSSISKYNETTGAIS